MDKLSNFCTVLLLDGSTIERKIRQYNSAYYIIYLGSQVPVARDQVVEGRQTYKEVQRFKDAT
jgi:hypothetical protein